MRFTTRQHIWNYCATFNNIRAEIGSMVLNLDDLDRYVVLEWTL